MIPKIIWQTHNYKYNDLPESLFKSSKTWKNLNPGWTYNYVDHMEREEFVKKESKDLYLIYKKSSPVTQSDIWRILVVYKFGGVYADMDSVCVKPLDYMLLKYQNEDFISVPRYNSEMVNNSHFAATKKSKTLKKIIKSVIEDNIENEYWHVWISFNKHVKYENIAYFDAAIHSKDFKEKFREYDIDYYGKNMSYRNYLKNILDLNDKEYLESISSDLAIS